MCRPKSNSKGPVTQPNSAYEEPEAQHEPHRKLASSSDHRDYRIGSKLHVALFYDIIARLAATGEQQAAPQGPTQSGGRGGNDSRDARHPRRL